MATWTPIEDNTDFNIIKDGKLVNAKNINHAIDNVKGNLQFLYERVENLEQDKGAVVSYDAPTDGSTGFDGMFPGTPVYWIPKEGTTGGYWTPAEVALRDAVSGEDRDFHWIYDDPALAQGIVIRRYATAKTVDVCFSGSIVFDIIEDSGSYYIAEVGDTVVANSNLITDLFNSHLAGAGGDSTVSSSFDPGISNTPDTLRPGVYYLSTDSGKLVPNSPYTRVMAVVLVDKVGSDYQLRFLVCPDGFGGEKFHIHRKESLNNELAVANISGKGIALIDSTIPDSWYPSLSDAGDRKISTAMGEIERGSEVYPYSELVGASWYTSGENVGCTYTASTTINEDGGWLSAQDAYFTSQVTGGTDDIAEFAIPASAIWGYTIQEITQFNASDNPLRNWAAPVDYSHILLTIDGVPVPSTSYIIDSSGIWWVAEGAEHAPMFEFFSDDMADKPLEIWFIDPLGESEEGNITDIESDDLIVTANSIGQAAINSKHTYLSSVLAPVLPFNPTDDVQRASETETALATSNKLITPETAKYAIEYFCTLTDTDQNRSCQEYSGTWDSLVKTGFYRVSDMENNPGDQDIASVRLALVGSRDNDVFQFAFESSESYLRVGTQAAGVVGWGDWQRITEKNNDPLYLPGGSTSSDTATHTTLDIASHAGRELVSLDEQIDIVDLPSIESENQSRYDGADFTFVNKMTPNSDNSVLVLHLQNPLSGGNASYLISVGQSCNEADHHMGRVLYALASDIPDYLDAYPHPSSGDIHMLGDCEAPQAYGSSAARLSMIGSDWVLSGGTGVWFAVTESYWDSTLEALLEEENSSGILSTLLSARTRPIKLSSKALRAAATYTVDYSGDGSVTLKHTKA